MDKLFTFLGGLLAVLFFVLLVAVWAAPFAVDYYIFYISDLSWFIKIPAVCVTSVCQLFIFLGMGTVLSREED